MYKDRISSHQLSYSAVNSFLSDGKDSSLSGKYRTDDVTDKFTGTYRSSLKTDNNSDLAFLRNTVGPTTITDNSFLRVQDNKKSDVSLRQTMDISSNVKNYIKGQSFGQEKKTFRTESTGEKITNQKNQKREQKKDERWQKIMQKFDKKNETKQALKLLQQLKELKRKQQELKKQRKNEVNKDNEGKNKSTGIGYDANSPVNFSKKNKVDYYTPSYDKSEFNEHNQSLSINNSKQTKEKKTSYDLTRDEMKVDLNPKSYRQRKSHEQPTLTTNFMTLATNPNKSTSDLAGNYDSFGIQSKFSSLAIEDNKKYLTSSNGGNKYDKVYKPPSSYSTSNESYLCVTAGDSTGEIISNARYSSRNSSFVSSSGSYGPRYSDYPLKSTPLKEVFLNKKVSINDFILGKNLGEGKFGTVYQAFDKRTKSIYALKKIPKSVIKSHWMIDQFILEVKIQHYCNHPNILSLHGCFDDYENVYILLQYMEEGTLFLHLKKNSTLCEKQAAVKVKQVASAIQYLHENGIAHRDLKPENIVISHGVCKLCDFGWATMCDERRKTYCGTFDYAAPEILQGQEYDMSVDLWCLGILAYEILVGKAPFYHISRKETMKKIMNCENQKINYPSTMSYEARSFIEQLLKRNPEERLKSEDLLKHPFILLADR